MKKLEVDLFRNVENEKMRKAYEEILEEMRECREYPRAIQYSPWNDMTREEKI